MAYYARSISQPSLCQRTKVAGAGRKDVLQYAEKCWFWSDAQNVCMHCRTDLERALLCICETLIRSVSKHWLWQCNCSDQVHEEDCNTVSQRSGTMIFLTQEWWMTQNENICLYLIHMHIQTKVILEQYWVQIVAKSQKQFWIKDVTTFYEHYKKWHTFVKVSWPPFCNSSCFVFC